MVYRYIANNNRITFKVCHFSAYRLAASGKGVVDTGPDIEPPSDDSGDNNNDTPIPNPNLNQTSLPCSESGGGGCFINIIH